MPNEYVRPTFVERAKLPPGKCVITGDIDGPFIDCGIKYENRGFWTRMYLHTPWVEQVARDLLGMLPRSEKVRLEARIAELESEKEALDIAFQALSREKVPA